MKNLFFILALLGIMFGSHPMFAQTAYQGFNRLQYEQVLRTGECPGCSLYQGQFSKLNLSGADFRGAMLVGAHFRYAILRGANFKGAAVRAADFTGADLSGAIWTHGKRCQKGSTGYCQSQ